MTFNFSSVAVNAVRNVAGSDFSAQKQFASFPGERQDSALVVASSPPGASVEFGETSRQAEAAALGNKVSYVQTQDGLLKNVSQIVNRVAELKRLSVDPAKSVADVAGYDSEFSNLKEELRQIAEKEFNGEKVFTSGAANFLSMPPRENEKAAATDASAPLDGTLKDIAGAGKASEIAGNSTIPGYASLGKIEGALSAISIQRMANGEKLLQFQSAAELLSPGASSQDSALYRLNSSEEVARAMEYARSGIVTLSGTVVSVHGNLNPENALRLLS